MRLTLRTMLAYMDDILEPADAQDVGKKIEESEFATGLMHRMRDVTRRLRVGAPKLHGRGLGLDANTVAEYLDNTLPSERVADFEKVCLESDVHLAEVTAAHQILALVLGEPAEIETTGRQRMYGLPTDAEASPRRDAATKAPDAVRHKRRKKKRRKVEVPDYLREPAEPQGGRRLVPVLLLLLLAVAAAAGGYTWWKNRPDQLAAVGAGADLNANATQNDANGLPSAPGDGDTANADKESDTAQGASTAGGAQTESGAKPETTTEVPDQEQAADSTPSDDADRAASKPDESDDASTEPSPDEPPAANAQRATRGSGKPRAANPETAEDDGGDAVATADGVGRLISEHEVLVRLPGKKARRVPARGTVYAGETLTALPAYRPSVVLASGITVQLYGGAQASFTALDADGVPEIRLDSGRLVLLSAARPTKVRLRAGDQAGVITFGQEDAVLAVEVSHKSPDGSDPETEAAPALVDLYVASGEVAWQGEKGRQQAIRGKAHWPLGRGDPAAGKNAEELPVWIEANDLTPMERRAAASVDDYLHVDKPVVPALIELLAHRLEENSILAIQSLALLGQFEPLVPLLNDPTRRRLDNNDIVSLRAAVARGPASAAEVRKAFEAVRGQKQGDELYRMLWGYSPEQLEEGAAAQLIEWLSHQELDYRVLSFWNLHHITGFGYLYRPEVSEIKRRTAVQRWRQKLEAGLIVPKANED